MLTRGPLGFYQSSGGGGDTILAVGRIVAAVVDAPIVAAVVVPPIVAVVKPDRIVVGGG